MQYVSQHIYIYIILWLQGILHPETYETKIHSFQIITFIQCYKWVVRMKNLAVTNWPYLNVTLMKWSSSLAQHISHQNNGLPLECCSELDTELKRDKFHHLLQRLLKRGQRLFERLVSNHHSYYYMQASSESKDWWIWCAFGGHTHKL